MTGTTSIQAQNARELENKDASDTRLPILVFYLYLFGANGLEKYAQT